MCSLSSKVPTKELLFVSFIRVTTNMLKLKTLRFPKPLLISKSNILVNKSLLQRNISKINQISFEKRTQQNSFVSQSRDFTSIPSKDTIVKRGEEREKIKLKVGDVLHGFKVVEVSEIPERNIIAILMNHIQTGASHLHLDTSDTNNVFSVTFKTIPKDNRGVAHILEHTTLCGSEKYPVRDPFFNMIKRSLNTFMNAWTGPDYTSYPFSTVNLKDFYNLLDVYLDATFFPLLNVLDFKQEGHRLEFEKIDDPSSPLTFKGVVYNEMKGSMSDSATIFSRKLQGLVFNDKESPYHYNSGGDPSEIPDLTYDQLKQFHKIFYHPSNAHFFTYGDLSVSNHLEFINKVISKFPKLDEKFLNTQTYIPLQQSPRFLNLLLLTKISENSKEERHIVAGPPVPLGGDPERQSKVIISTIANKIGDISESLNLGILDSLLMGGINSPMYKKLIESNIGFNYAPSSGYSSYLQQSTFGIGLQDIRKEDIPKIEAMIKETLEESANKGFEEKRIESILHQIEISQKHVTSNFGIQIMSGIMHPWIHGSNPIESVRFNKWMDKIRQDISSTKGSIFSQKLREYLLQNKQKKVILEMHPDPEYTLKLSSNEKERLEKIRNQLSDQQIQDIISTAKLLKKRQEEVQNVNLLPTLTISDIPRTSPNEINSISTKDIKNGTKLYLCPQPTNGIVYLRLRLAIPDLSEDLIPYVPLFCSILTQMGTANHSYRDLVQEIESYTGGISVSASLEPHFGDIDIVEGYIQIKSLAFERNIDKMLDLLKEIILYPIFTDTELLRTYISQRASSIQENLISDGHSFAKTYSASKLNRYHSLHELWDGVSQIKFMQQLSQDCASESSLSQISSKLQQLAKEILGNGITKGMIHAEEKRFSMVENKVSMFLESIGNQSVKRRNIGEYSINKETTRAFISVPGSVNYVAKSLSSIPYSHVHSPSLRLLSRILSGEYLHRELREKGGSYGGGSTFSQLSGLFSFYSYRDPNTLSTLDHFSKSIDWILSGNFTEQNVEEAKLNIFSKIDHPLSPSEKGTLYFASGIDKKLQQQYRERLFKASKSDLQEVALKYLQKREDESIAIVGSDQNIEQFRKDPKWQIIE